ncbi:MAG: hypothetical protein IT430_09155 [Phycisphaerales bacterium]|nr:hypothetical protein [Phycisphaerales bacterium]
MPDVAIHEEFPGGSLSTAIAVRNAQALRAMLLDRGLCEVHLRCRQGGNSTIFRSVVVASLSEDDFTWLTEAVVGDYRYVCCRMPGAQSPRLSDPTASAKERLDVRGSDL